MLRINSNIRTFLESFSISCVVAVGCFVASESWVKRFSEPPDLLELLLTGAAGPGFIIIALLFYFYSRRLAKRVEGGIENNRRRAENILAPLVLTFGILSILSAIPAFLFVILSVDPLSQKKLLRIYVFFASVVCSSVYYYLNTHRFHSLADKITFFSGVGLGPVAVVQIFLDE